MKSFSEVNDQYRKACEAAAILGAIADGAYTDTDFNERLSGDEFDRSDLMFARDMNRIEALARSMQIKWERRADGCASQLEKLKFSSG